MYVNYSITNGSTKQKLWVGMGWKMQENAKCESYHINHLWLLFRPFLGENNNKTKKKYVTRGKQ